MTRAAVRLLTTVVLATAASAQSPAPPARKSTPAAAKKAVPAGKSALDKATLETYLRHLELWPPQVQVRIGDLKPFIAGLYSVDVHLTAGAASRDTVYYVSHDGRHVIRGSAHDVNQNPFQAEVDKIKLERQPSFGPAGARLTLVVFSDFQCPLCREEAKSLRQNIPRDFPNDVRVFFTDFPLESIHPWSKRAAIAGRCVYREKPAAFWDFHDWIYEHQAEIKPENLESKVLEWAKSKGVDGAGLGRCMETRATEAEVDREIAEGKKLEIEATPTSFLNGRRLVGNIPWESMGQILKLELEYERK